jgi:xylan 1,4-beta-xylosidase
MLWDFRKGHSRFAGIVAQEYDHRQGKLVGPMTNILAKPVLTEGPNLYRRDGWYYLMLAEGGTGWNHGIAMARSKRLLGPYDLDPQTSVITSRDDYGLPLQKAGHGELVETPAGEWYLAHLASRPITPERRCVLGRETWLEKVEWSPDGWLRVAGGGHHGKVSWPAPKGLAAHPWPARPERDEFESTQLGPQWSTLRVPADATWLSLTERPGWLRLRGRDSQHSLFDQSLVARRVQHFRFTAETCLEFSPAHFTQSAGLMCYYDTRTHFYLRVTHDEARGKTLGVVLSDDGQYDELPASELSIAGWGRMFLRAAVDLQRLQFSVSPDGQTWQPCGPVLDASKLSDDYGAGLHFTGAMVGLCAQDVGGARTIADFDYFDYRPGLVDDQPLR